MRAITRVALVLIVALVWTVMTASPARPAPTARVVYRPPVTAPIIEHFRPPAHQYGPGNRGVDYLTVPGAPVHAAASGQVVFAGPVAGRLVVVVRHTDGLRTTYDGLAGVDVRPGEAVQGGERVGTAGGRLHFGVRDGSSYLDPMVLFGAPTGTRGGGVRLVPTDGGPARARSPT